MLRGIRIAALLTVLLAGGALLAQAASDGHGAPATKATGAGHPAATAPAAKAPAAASDDDVEEVEDVQAVPVAPEASAAEQGGWEDVIGRFHVAVVHLPIGWLLMAFLLDVLARRRPALQPAGLWALGAAVAAFVPAIATGLLREDFVSQAPAVKALLETHETLMLVTAGVATAALAWRLLFRARFAGWPRSVYWVLMAAACVLVTIGGHWGGKVAFGAEYLPF